jgi:Concanavalin A-like lectin/glucanases superfamily/VanZ like family
VLFVIIAATALPIQFRPPRDAEITFTSGDVPDIVANVLLYLPLGMVLGRGRILRAVLAGAALSTAAEAGQIVMLHRDPSLVDVATNVAGAAVGAWWVTRRRRAWRPLRLARWMAIPGALAALAPVLYLEAQAGRPLNPRGLTQPGTLEASWQFDDAEGREVADASAHQVDGRFRRAPGRTDGIRGGAAVLDRGNYVRFPASTALRLEGSMTITAWINSSDYPEDDAAIVSQRRVDHGYQLDTTIDEGPRTVGYKLSDSCGHLMARYGATPLERGRWYHVAGVYDASARTMHVYVDGDPDDGAQVGIVSGSQLSARGQVYVGARANSRRFPFTGAVDDVRIYSFALSADQIRDVMQGRDVAPPETRGASRPPALEQRPCARLPDKEDKDLPFAAAVSGMSLGFLAATFWPARRRLLALAFGVLAGLAMVTAFGRDLPAFNVWTIPATAAVGAMCVAASVREEGGDAAAVAAGGPAARAPD